MVVFMYEVEPSWSNESKSPIFLSIFMEAKYDKDIFQILYKFMLQAHIYNENRNPIPKKALS